MIRREMRRELLADRVFFFLRLSGCEILESGVEHCGRTRKKKIIFHLAAMGDFLTAEPRAFFFFLLQQEKNRCYTRK